MKISYDDNDIHSSIPYIYYTIEKKRHPTRFLLNFILEEMLLIIMIFLVNLDFFWCNDS